jgi:hypothetical protein
MRAYRHLSTAAAAAAAVVAAIGIIAGGAALDSGSTGNGTAAPVGLAQNQLIGADCTECACLTEDAPAPTTLVPTSPVPATAAFETSGSDGPASGAPTPGVFTAGSSTPGQSGAVDALVPAAMVVPAAARAMDPPKGGNSYSITVTQAKDPNNPNAGKTWQVTRNVCKVKADLKIDEKNQTTIKFNGPDKFGEATFYKDVKVEITFSDFDAAKCSDPTITFLGGFAAKGPQAYQAWSTEDGKYVVHMSFSFNADNYEGFFDLYRAGFVVAFSCVP